MTATARDIAAAVRSGERSARSVVEEHFATTPRCDCFEAGGIEPGRLDSREGETLAGHQRDRL